jgi:hypothetical protein
MTKILLVFLTVVFLAPPRAALAFEEEHFSAIKQMGRLNGIALHCKALEETQRLKRALILNLPKRRQLGELFDNETHHSYMRFIQEGTECPGLDQLRSQIGEAIRELESVLKP